MRKKIIWAVLAGLILPPAAHAQIPVTDVLSIAQLVRMAIQVRQTIELMKEEYQTIQRVARGYGGSFAPYRIPTLPQLNHEVGRYPFGAPLLEGLNSGDPYGDRYKQVVRSVLRPGGLFEQLPPDARKAMEAAFAGIEIADSIATMGVHESAQARGYALRIAQLIERLQRDVTASGSEYHQVTAIADKLAIAGMVNGRLNQNSNQVESAILEQQIARNLRLRREAAESMNMALTRMKDNGDSTQAIVGGATEALQNWRLR
jgi:hypothetical protein